ncbi:MAG: AarF/ABC1/UbiB kinase family protein [Chloroflexi bacterium]|nr:AarF/ABC1/UbiB kinase family protein [Chloroflexota bacterium]
MAFGTSTTTSSTPTMDRIGAGSASINLARFVYSMAFFIREILGILLFEIILKRILGEAWAARGRSNRLRIFARRFRSLAVRMGGVMIKLGQFISARIDVMPPELTEELGSLQDEIPAERFDKMRPIIEQELGAPAEQIFEEFDQDARAAASLGQVYMGRLQTGERVAIKIQRPRIERIVRTDLATLRIVSRWIMLWGLIRRRADVPALLEEFARTLWEELDYVSEANNAERFKKMFADNLGVYVPEVYRQYCTERVLVLEDVTSIKITDTQALDAAGINRREAARRLMDVYLYMIFEHGFFHADPHPGNLFIYPLPEEATERMFGDRRRSGSRPFYVVFIDFGMVGYISDRVKEGLREILIATGTRDAKRTIRAYQMLGVLLPSADLQRIEAAQAEAMDYTWGKTSQELAEMPMSDMEEFAQKYRDLMFDMPFQIPQDFIYLGRAIGILQGITHSLDPDFNAWMPIAEYAQGLLTREGRNGGNNRRGGGLILREGASLAQSAIGLPKQLENISNKLASGNVEVQVRTSGQLRSEMRRLEYAANGINRAVIFGSLLVASTLFVTSGFVAVGIGGYVVTAGAYAAFVFRRRREY